MKEMHPFREARREALPAPDFQGPVTMKLLLEFLYALCRGLDWQSGVLAADWGLRGLLEAEQIPPLYPDSCYCYGDVSGAPSGEKCLEALDFARRKGLWLEFLDRGFDFAEFAWLYDGIARRALRSRTQWELALYAALRQLRYTLKISGSAFALYDGNGARRYFGFNSDQNAQRALLKLLFPLNLP